MTDAAGTALLLDASDLQELVREVRAAIDDCALPAFWRSETGPAKIKSAALDPVTQIDLAIETRLTECIRQLWPGAYVLGEESGGHDPERLAAAAAAPLAFVIDPLDGTWNFVAGTPVFGTMVAATAFGRPVWGLIHEAITDRTLVAAEGRGVQMRQNGTTRVLAPPQTRIADLTQMVASLPKQPLHPLPRVGRMMSSGASCHDYRLLAEGSLHALLAFKPTPWDHLAGSLIACELGGKSAWIDGRPFTLGTQGAALLTASTPAAWAMFAADMGWIKDRAPLTL